jgi:hypothetical protein
MDCDLMISTGKETITKYTREIFDRGLTIIGQCLDKDCATHLYLFREFSILLS